jgi:hypothetical protein
MRLHPVFMRVLWGAFWLFVGAYFVVLIITNSGN